MKIIGKVPELILAAITLMSFGCTTISQPLPPLSSERLEKLAWHQNWPLISGLDRKVYSALAVSSNSLVATKDFSLETSSLVQQMLSKSQNPLISMLYTSELGLSFEDRKFQHMIDYGSRLTCLCPSCGCGQQSVFKEADISQTQWLREARERMAWIAMDSQGRVYLSGKQGKVISSGLKLYEKPASKSITSLWDQQSQKPDSPLVQPLMIHGLAIGPDDVLFFSDPLSHQIFKVVNRELISVLNSQNSQFADTQTKIKLEPSTLELDAKGNLYFLEWGGHRILKLSHQGKLSVLAGGQEPGFRDATGSEARFKDPYDLALTSKGDVLVSDSGNHRIRKITSEGQVSTILGDGVARNQDGHLSQARLAAPQGIDISPDGTVYVIAAGETYRFRLE